MHRLCTFAAAALLAGCGNPRPAALLAPGPVAAVAPAPDFASTIKERVATERATVQAQREAFVAASPELSDADRKLLLTGGYALDWPAAWVRASRGEPQRTSKSVSALGTFESWTYRSGHEVIYFLNGRVARWHHTD